MKRFLIGIVLLFCLALATGVSAQSALTFDTVQIQLWPEYDRPSMLVIYTLEISPEVALPIEFTIRIPARAGEPHAVAVLENNQLMTAEYSSTAGGDWTEITMQASAPMVQIEYYDPALSQSDNPREFQFSWDFDYPIADLILSVKQPVNATNLLILPQLGSPQDPGDGLLTYTASLGNLPSGETTALELSYQKADTVLAVDAFSQQAAADGSSLASQGGLPTWGWVLIGAGAVLVFGGGFYLLNINRKAGSESKYRQKKQSRSQTDTGIFCHQCGAQAHAGDKFCRECGTKLRR